jgi:hypothetical protein
LLDIFTVSALEKNLQKWSEKLTDAKNVDVRFVVASLMISAKMLSVLKFNILLVELFLKAKRCLIKKANSFQTDWICFDNSPNSFYCFINKRR